MNNQSLSTKKSLSIIGTGGTAVNNFVRFNKLSSLKQHTSIFLWVRNSSLGYVSSLRSWDNV